MKLYHMAEQRCKKPYGCALENCMAEGRSTEECNKLMRLLRECIDTEKQKILDEQAGKSKGEK